MFDSNLHVVRFRASELDGLIDSINYDARPHQLPRISFRPSKPSSSI